MPRGCHGLAVERLHGFTPGASAHYTFNAIPGRTASITVNRGVAGNGTFDT